MATVDSMSPQRPLVSYLYWAKRWIYRGDRPGRLARVLNEFWAKQYATGGRLARTRDVQLEVRGRRSGQLISFPIVLADVDGAWYAVSMLGANANWARNVRTAGGHAVIRHGNAVEVRLVEVPVSQRAPILKRYLEVAPGARPHINVDPREPVSTFEPIAAQHPVFRVDGLPSDS
jgi:hypothetical protein